MVYVAPKEKPVPSDLSRSPRPTRAHRRSPHLWLRHRPVLPRAGHRPGFGGASFCASSSVSSSIPKTTAARSNGFARSNSRVSLPLSGMRKRASLRGTLMPRNIPSWSAQFCHGSGSSRSGPPVMSTRRPARGGTVVQLPISHWARAREFSTTSQGSGHMSQTWDAHGSLMRAINAD
jgi:hypothetical protein